MWTFSLPSTLVPSTHLPWKFTSDCQRRKCSTLRKIWHSMALLTLTLTSSSRLLSTRWGINFDRPIFLIYNNTGAATMFLRREYIPSTLKLLKCNFLIADRSNLFWVVWLFSLALNALKYSRSCCCLRPVTNSNPVLPPEPNLLLEGIVPQFLFVLIKSHTLDRNGMWYTVFLGFVRRVY